ncbi:general secretion pathway protein GspF [Plectonema cf. radiosum LEGE 06105]|uniref:General secretion pathway protein GspF n=1 Tax=Plectonema cf. radiosum LEGE 06105 TaxID=945769 RepID=A0A8J7F1T7_9CYAN|nr:general secretion pathway protein GspF [Plectonema radiosum]MBE9213150.1 general secretion pathway protein GspF [Plectonema cf. radiosum LEGE 06105]
MFPWIRIGKYARNKYGKYNIHHTGVGYRHLGHEELGKDVLPLCLFAHWLIHGGKMKAKAPWRPNILQKTLHLWCSFPLIVKQLFLFLSTLLLLLCLFT